MSLYFVPCPRSTGMRHGSFASRSSGAIPSTVRTLDVNPCSSSTPSLRTRGSGGIGTLIGT